MMRINLFAGPCAGKTLLSKWLVCELAKTGVNVELVDEYIKRWAYEKKTLRGWDQKHVFNRQLEKEEFFLKHGVNCIVTDSPLLMQIAYMQQSGNERFIAGCLADIQMFEEEHPSLNIFLDRGRLPYKTEGRWQSYEQALELDRVVRHVLEQNVKDFYEFETTDWDNILKEVFRYLKTCSC